MNIRQEFVLAGAIVSALFFMAYRQAFPFGEMMTWGARVKAKQANEVRSQHYSYYISDESQGSKLLLDIKSGIHFWHPQVVIWVTDTNGHFIKTLFITESSAKGLFMSGRTADNFKSFDEKKGTDPISRQNLRLVDALPYWSHSRGKETQQGFYAPTFDQPVIDGMTGATPQGNFYVQSQVPDSLVYFDIYLEVNVAFDDNEYYSEYDFPDDSLYHGGTGLLGQPSLIYRATLNKEKNPYFTLMQLIGHSHHSGRTGHLYPDLTTITTAQRIIDRVVVSLEMDE
ncbi:hypothetical protein SAMN04488029_2238 [Reichenbachiella faecimaris]|uniref:Uncharacterized protein n=1 Tax=Reichenbachiella faecimaris TaxID=692418 RepID=A0A1W2GDZ0_REIFA|nr:hypothetical protein [Reichenbachiella faecimaris]SMD34893.1 hypothetical protein SAMN04488029_2238 [Reichenbachiella faecimaris]